MFKTVTWGQYAGLVFVLLVAYYLYVAAVYYRVEILAKLKGKGRGGAAAPAAAGAVVARPSLVGGSGPLLSPAALAIHPPAAEEAEEAEEAPAQEHEEEAAELDEVKIEEPNTDNITSAGRDEEADELPGPQAVDSEADFTVGVAQLADYFEGAAEGNITEEELVAQMPELENTDLLVAFFQSNTKAAQQLTSQYYVDIPEPVLD